MSNTINFLLESDHKYAYGLHGLTENHRAFNELDPITESQAQILGFTLEKVSIHREDEFSPCIIEYSNNLEKYIEDQKIFSIEEAMENIFEAYEDVTADNVIIVVDESCINKVDINALKEKYKVVRK